MNNNIEWSIIDAVVLAGSPEFLHGPLKPIYDGLASRPNIPLICIGVGYSNTSLATLTENEKLVLARDNTRIIVRQQDLIDALPKKAIHLPCPAFYCHDYLSPYAVKRHDNAVILQAPVGHQRISQKLYEKMLALPGDKMVHYIDDYVFLQKQGIDAFYHPEPVEFLKKLWEYRNVHTTRLHGGIAAMSSYSNAYFYYDEDNHRIQQAIKPFLNFTDRYEITTFKISSFKEYMKVLDKSF